MNKKKLQYQALITFFSVIIIITAMNVSSVLADPSSLPPTGPVDILLHEGADAQTKAGPLTINDNLHGETINATQINTNSLCLNGDCRNSWPVPDLSVQNLNTVMSHGYTISSGYLNFNGVTLYVNGVGRTTFPKPTYLGWDDPTITTDVIASVNPTFCIYGFGPICSSPYHVRDGALIGLGGDYWGTIGFAYFARKLEIGSN